MNKFHAEIKNGKKGTAADHALYIARERWHRNREDLIFKSHGNLPEWANDDPIDYWNAADRYERKNGAAYREWIIALPSEFNASQQLDLVQDIARALVGEKPYQFACHSTDSSLSGERNTHAHLMYSDRRPDSIVRSRERAFSRYCSDNPSRGGCKKDSGGKSLMEMRTDLTVKREIIADIQNSHLAKHGYAPRMDSRTLKTQGISRAPERHLGPARIRNLSAAQKSEVVSKRTQLKDSISGYTP